MRYLGIDYGEKRIGISVSDPSGRISFPKGTVLNRGNPRMAEQLMSLLREEGVSKIVVGLPLALGGSETEQSQRIREFVGRLKKKTSLPVEFENEMFTTRMVKQEGIKKEHADEAAAAVILQSYLDRINRSL